MKPTLMDELQIPIQDQATAVLINSSTFGKADNTATEDIIRVTVEDSTEQEHNGYLHRMEEENFVLLESLAEDKDAEGKYDAKYLFRKAS